jgi:Ca2+/H+ antiporter
LHSTVTSNHVTHQHVPEDAQDEDRSVQDAEQRLNSVVVDNVILLQGFIIVVGLAEAIVEI